MQVIELASVLAGPAVGMFFAELGANVIKIENKTTDGDVTRKWKLPSESADHDISSYFSCVNWGKKSIGLNLSNKDDYDLLINMVQEADVVITSYKPGDAEKFGVDYETLKSHKLDLVYGEINGYGTDDPRPAFDAILQAESGFMFMNGTPETPPLKVPIAFIDILAAHQLKEGMLVALYERLMYGRGQRVSVSLMDSAVSALANQATNWLVGKTIPQRMGSYHPNIAPYGNLLPTADGKEILLACGTDRQFQRLVSALGISELAEEEKFKTNPGRVTNRDELNELLCNASAKLDSKILLKELAESKVPAGLIQNMEEVFSMETARQMLFEEIEYGLKATRQTAFVSERKRSLLRPPRYDEHREEIRKRFQGEKIGTEDHE